MTQTNDIWVLTSATLDALLDTVTANITVILPVALTLFGIMFSISYLPKLFRKFGN